uniref:diacylglycerol kinase (ATP) n=1 Tax=Cyprinus carpio TaxID=7962 RepID=A0A8C2L1M2_CYPCA
HQAAMSVYRLQRTHWNRSVSKFNPTLYRRSTHYNFVTNRNSVKTLKQITTTKLFELYKITFIQIHLKKATVFLNPAACKGKANHVFEKNAAPILHLELMDQTDMLIIAGVITGLLRRSLHVVSNNKVQHVISATLSILKGETVPLDVLQKKSETRQPVFALLGLRWGAFRDVTCSISNYWYLGLLKTRAAHWFSGLKQWPQTHQTSLSYLAPVPRPHDLPTEIPPGPNLLNRIYHRLKNYLNPTPPKEPKPELWENKDFSTLELTVSTNSKNPVKRREADSVLITLDPDSLTAGQFITEGTKKALNPMESVENALQIEACEGASFYDTDNEEYEAMSVEVTPLPRKLWFFCSAECREQLAQAQC